MGLGPSECVRGLFRQENSNCNPLSNGWMSNYPTLGRDDGDNYLEVDDDVLNDLCLEVNFGINVQVPHTIGFCMFKNVNA